MARVELGAVLATAQRIAETTIAAEAAVVDREARWPRTSMKELQRELGGLVVEQRLGGLGHGLLAVARVGEVTGRYCASTSICFGMHLVGSAVLGAKATAWHEQRYLRPIAAGEHLTTLALSEPGTGSEFWLPQTRMHDDGDDVVLNGTKSFVTNGPHVDSYVVNLAAGASATGSFSMAALDAETPGMHWGPAWHGFGMRGNDSRSLRLRDVRLRRSQLLGEHGDEIWFVFNVVAPYFLMAMAGTYLGVAAAAFDVARDHLRRRRHTHSGRRLASVPVLQHRLGGMWAQVERARRLLYFAAEEAQAGGPAALLALCSAKAEIADTVGSVTNEAMTIVGGIGYAGEETLQRLLRDGRAAHVMSPTTDILRTWAGRALLDEPMLQE
ncbi:acyl-CoA dehydrogenase family protein [Actinoplanes sp. DH11]|uniref:acyl-CoA dehydrogenase family protein n=1 Tax=Actinoplanes sp. DH11 TaxID=2857011 RepID=UPI001E5AE82E|nr:acyl-CoA dehydrogenase [Actinoplanes sp. DH11]